LRAVSVTSNAIYLSTILPHYLIILSSRCIFQFRNETSYALGLYYKKAIVDKLGLTPTGETTNPFDHNVRIAIIEPDAIYNIPLYIAYHCPIYILPAYLE